MLIYRYAILVLKELSSDDTGKKLSLVVSALHSYLIPRIIGSNVMEVQLGQLSVELVTLTDRFEQETSIA